MEFLKSRRRKGLALILSASCAYGQPSDWDAFVARVRAAALAYDGQLADFLCIQTTRRSADNSGSGKHWKLLETQVVEVAYVGHREKYRLISVNGKDKAPDKAVKRGYFTPGGEFGSFLKRIFEPRANAQFSWDHEEFPGGKRVCVFRYQVARSSTTMVMQADLDNVPLAHHGVVYVECDTGAVLRFQTESEEASVQRNGRAVAVGQKCDVRYVPAKIGGKEFLLPQTADEIAIFGKGLTRAEISFDRYRKYEASSTITFDDPPKP
ncbi:MAG TPA: hypothetical protein VMT15_11850 [Bryobacteraceae bacterium]|nr:hypothetical protein [Bryobacteraceae bacterium]